MSKVVSNQVTYNCMFDHKMGESCDGHKLCIERSLTSDTVSVIVDGEIKHVFDENEFYAILAAAQGLD